MALISLFFISLLIVSVDSADIKKKAKKPIVFKYVTADTLKGCFQNCGEKECAGKAAKKDKCPACLDACNGAGVKKAGGKVEHCIELCTPKYDQENWRIKDLLESCEEYCDTAFVGDNYTASNSVACKEICKPLYPYPSKIAEESVKKCEEKCSTDKPDTMEICKVGCRGEFDFSNDKVQRIVDQCRDYCLERRDGEDRKSYNDNLCLKGCLPFFPKRPEDDARIKRLCKMHCLVPSHIISWYY